MLQAFGIAACIAVFAFLVTFAYALTWTAICMIAGGGIGVIATLFYVDRRNEKRRKQEKLEQAWEREAERQWMLELVEAARGAHVDVPTTLEIPKQKIQRLK